MRRLEGKVALISGTARGQGRAAALRFAEEGAIVVGGDLLHEAALETAVITLTRQLAAEGAPHGIRANCTSPGMTDTEATRGDLLADHPMRTIARHIPLGRVGLPDEVVHAAVFLASDEASYITGANLVVDGGWSAVLPGPAD
jgi:NAD(P)-dependent dehydrogenase (short-subunit alcohol dehydrogenase family)